MFGGFQWLLGLFRNGQAVGSTFKDPGQEGGGNKGNTDNKNNNQTPQESKERKEGHTNVDVEGPDDGIIPSERSRRSSLTHDQRIYITEGDGMRDTPSRAGTVQYRPSDDRSSNIQTGAPSASTRIGNIGFNQPSDSPETDHPLPDLNEDVRTSLTSHLQTILSPAQRNDNVHYTDHDSGQSSPISPPIYEFVFNILIGAPSSASRVGDLARRLLLDLLSEYNFMSDDLQNDLALPLHHYEAGKDGLGHITATGRSNSASHWAEPLGQVEARWVIVDDSLTEARRLTKEFTTWFIVIKTTEFDVMLGRPSFSKYQLHRRFTSLVEPWKRTGYHQPSSQLPEIRTDDENG